MDDVITFAEELRTGTQDKGPPWKILIADDEPSVHLVTKLALGDFTFEGRRLELLSAYGEEDTRRILNEHPDVALVLLDVVMDTMDSGFAMVRYIRDTLRNKDLRIIMRTGQSGNAPEDRIIIDYDINDFKDKTELTVAKLRTTMISSLRTYSHLKIIAAEQRKASANRAYLYTIINSLSSVLITLDLNLKVLLWNDEAQRWTGTTAAEASGRSLFDVAPVFEPLKALFQDLLTGRASGRIERTSVPLWKGKQAFVHLILQTLAGSGGPEILLKLDDHTEAKQLDDQMSRSQKVNAFTVLAAGVANELGHFFQESAPRPGASDRGPKANGLLQRLAQFSPLTAPPGRSVDWEALVRRRIQETVLPGRLTLEFRGSGGPAWVGAQEAGLESMVDQLLRNAVDAMTVPADAPVPDGPRQIDVALSLAFLKEGDKVKHPDLTNGQYWTLTVQDRGVGMGPDTLDRVFDPYFTTKSDSQGLGLGLPLVYSLVESLGGLIEVTSVLGSGTLVRVALPSAVATPAPVVATDGQILLCDDEPLMRQVAGKILRHHGYHVLEAQDGASALEQFQAHASEIRLVILDMVLPGVPGINVFREIHLRAPGTPVLLTSGFGRGEDVEQALAEGVSGFLQKPYRAETLTDAVRAALQTSG